MIIKEIELFGGDMLEVYPCHIIGVLKGKRRVLSTAYYNGGIRENLTHVFNSDSSMCQTTVSLMKAPTIKEHMAVVAEEIGLNKDTSAGMCTAAQMSNMSVVKKSYNDLSVIAIATAGIDKNGGRCGDPSAWYEENGDIQMISGTINIMVFINGTLEEGTLASALMTIAEARTAAVGELFLPSVYSRGLATGSGTDKAMVISMADYERTHSDAGKHSKLGELIALSVMETVKEALFLQTEVSPKRQMDILKRLSRFGLSKHRLHYKVLEIKYVSPIDYDNALKTINNDGFSVITASLIAHILDQMDWGMISCNDTCKYLENMLKLECNDYKDKEDCFVQLVEMVTLYYAGKISEISA